MPALNTTWRRRLGAGGDAARRWTRLLAAGLGALAGVHLVWTGIFGAPTDVIGPARTVVNKSAVVSSFAQDFVSVWLTATSAAPDVLAAFVSVPAGELDLPSTPAVVIGTPTVVAVTFTGPAASNAAAEVYSVVVGVTQRPYESGTPTRALYRVAVVWSSFGARAAGLPARVSGPGAGADLPLDYPATLGATDSVFTVVSGFLQAYLTAAGGVDRYATTESRLTGLGDVYRTVTVTSLRSTAVPATAPAEGATVQVLASVHAVTSQYAPTQLAYPLTLTGVGGRWCVSAIDQAPALSDDDELVPVITAAPAPAG